MSRTLSRAILVTLWITIVFGALWVLSFVYDKDKSFWLYVVLALIGNLAYDGLKIILKFSPTYQSDGKKVVKYALLASISLFFPGLSFVVGAAAFAWGFVPEIIGQSFAVIGSFAAIAFGSFQLAKAEAHFMLSRSCSIDW